MNDESTLDDSNTQMDQVEDGCSRSYVPYTTGSPNRMTFDVGVVIALSEEFNHFLKYIEVWNPETKPVMFWVDEHCFWSFEVKSTSGPVQIVAYLVGEMGTEFTAIATHILVEKWHVPFIINIGLTGSFDKNDLKVGSILIPTVITHYTALGKIEDRQIRTKERTHSSNEAISPSRLEVDRETEVEFMLGTRAFATNRLTVSQFANFLVSLDYEEWQKKCMEKISLPSNVDDFSPFPTIVLGHLASGNNVVDSERYKKHLRKSDRKLMGCEMEAAGFMIAEQFLQTSVKVASQFIALRCISDFAADKGSAEDKKARSLPTVGDQELPNREYAMRNATFLLLFMIDKGIITADVNSQVNQLENIVKNLKARKAEAERRKWQSKNLSIDELLSQIKQKNTQKFVKDLPPMHKERLFTHFSPNECIPSAITVIDSILINILQERGLLTSKNSSERNDSESVPIPRFPWKRKKGEITDLKQDEIETFDQPCKQGCVSRKIGDLEKIVQGLLTLISEKREEDLTSERFESIKASIEAVRSQIDKF